MNNYRKQVQQFEWETVTLLEKMGMIHMKEAEQNMDWGMLMVQVGMKEQ